MARKTQDNLPKDLAAARDRLDHWRRTRPKRGPLPAELWDLGASLAAQHGTWLVSKVLRLNYTTLKRRLEAGSTERPASAPPPLVGSAARPAPDFVEVRGGWPAGRADGTVVELQRADGARLVIRAGAGESLDLAGLAATFGGGGA